uniref:Galectin n=1 Tax=Pinctada fucata TaxID=50426 RepID=E9LJ44_PINFU|nr:tandem-repeat galectin [Pinctada fucata]
MAYNASTVVNPPIPYVGGIPGGLKVGTQIIINATLPYHENQFSINLQCGPNLNPKSNTALHFNPRPNEGCIVRNSLQHHSWGAEERHGGCPINKGQPFEIIILCQMNHYKVSVNGRHFCDFRHRIDRNHVNTLTVEGGVQVNSIRFDGHGGHHHGHHGHHHGHGVGGFIGNVVGGAIKAAMGPPSYPAGQVHPPPPSGGAPGQPMYNPPVPLTTQIPGGFYPGRMIFISGVPNFNASRFTINLQCGPYEGSDIALHCDMRLRVGGDMNVIVRNSCQGGGWGAEERHSPYFPFMPNANFDMIIMAEGNQFKIAVNNQHLLEFYHRLQPLTRIDTLLVKGDLRLTQVRIQ